MSEVFETNVDITTRDGVANAALLAPSSPSPGVLLWADAFGLRPATRAMAKQLAAEGYAVLVPNPFYRVSRQPFETAANFNFGNPADRETLQPLVASLDGPGNIESDASAYVAFLAARPEVESRSNFGTVGYCMGGALAFRTAAAVPERVGAAASFHGGGLVTAKPDSPHLLAPQIKAMLYFGIAANDDEREPETKEQLRQAFPTAQIEVWPGVKHGWSVPDMPGGVYDAVAAGRSHEKLLALLRAASAR